MCLQLFVVMYVWFVCMCKCVLYMQLHVCLYTYSFVFVYSLCFVYMGVSVCVCACLHGPVFVWMCPAMRLYVHFTSGCTPIQYLVVTCFQTQLDLVTAVICIG